MHPLYEIKQVLKGIRGVAQLVSASALGAEGPPFESEYPDKKRMFQTKHPFFISSFLRKLGQSALIWQIYLTTRSHWIHQYCIVGYIPLLSWTLTEINLNFLIQISFYQYIASLLFIWCHFWMRRIIYRLLISECPMCCIKLPVVWRKSYNLTFGSTEQIFPNRA